MGTKITVLGNGMIGGVILHAGRAVNTSRFFFLYSSLAFLEKPQKPANAAGPRTKTVSANPELLSNATNSNDVNEL